MLGSQQDTGSTPGHEIPLGTFAADEEVAVATFNPSVACLATTTTSAVVAAHPLIYPNGTSGSSLQGALWSRFDFWGVGAGLCPDMGETDSKLHTIGFQLLLFFRVVLPSKSNVIYIKRRMTRLDILVVFNVKEKQNKLLPL
ncbi:hypothetical protein Y1Q_0001935 [Alligator mississippiensis]|uniref:Uncharacterized protein n=1 Tax=Alligator mississippiensis TaxID=8496 RepID=A0A151PGA8_ALLMI|nr:hypothetical protein Y1Q_0001935 [Alligator mississippiensis]